MIARTLVAVVTVFCAGDVLGQGQDSEPYERDLQVIDAMLGGLFANANQAYFDVRGQREIKHTSFSVNVERLEDAADARFNVTVERGAGEPRTEQWSLSADDTAAAVRMRMQGAAGRDAGEELEALGERTCDVLWRREAGQFRAERTGECATGYATELVLSERQLWLSYGDVGGDYRMHRARAFECYADIPGVGVGGGRDEPFERYGGFPVHDQGGSAWFTSKEGRRLGISLFLVDWPINNYEGTFTRDSLVVYVNEENEDGRRQHGYAFTLPEADRIGINLKWILVNCYIESNEDAIPSM